jgi:hypothetical protein
MLRDNKVLFHQGERVRKIGERSGKMNTAAGGCALVHQGRRFPGLDSRPAAAIVLSIIMGAHENSVVQKHLRSRWLVIGVVQPHKRVTDEGSELAARFHAFLHRA